MAAGAAAIGAGGAQAVPRPATCPMSGNSKAPFYGVTATHVGEGREVHVAGNYRLTERNRRLTLTESGESKDLLRLKLRSLEGPGPRRRLPALRRILQRRSVGQKGADHRFERQADHGPADEAAPPRLGGRLQSRGPGDR